MPEANHSLDDRENITKSSTRISTVDKGVEHLQKTVNDMKTKIEDLEPVFHNISRGRSANMRDREMIAGDGLKIKDMMAREGLIEDPFPETFQWLLENEHPDGIQAPRFKQWLDSAANETPFWITSNPSSGKSTLMKYICTNSVIQEHLRRWSGDLRLLTCKVYLWSPGSTGQKSQAGLLRTMLYQILLEKPDLCPLATSKHYKYFQLAGTDAPSPPEWAIEDLRDSISQVVFETKHTHRLAVFIDGLDEYEGDLKSLTSFVKQTHSHERTKLCVSSRPWNIFRDEFKVYPSLRMELLTRPDIKNIEKLEFEIIEKADGVFLWVVLVVEKLITIARDNNDLHAIWKEFASLPPGLEDLYASMRRRMDKSLLEGASKMYQLLLSWKQVRTHSISAPDFWMAINCHDPGEPQDYPTNDMTAAIVRALERRVAGHTGGMLQVRCNTPKATRTSVDFLHRTVFDWLQSIWPTIISDGATEYDPNLVLASTLVSRSRHYYSSGPDAIRDVFHLCRSCKSCTGSRIHLLGIIGKLQQHELEGLERVIVEPEYTVFKKFPVATLRSYIAMTLSCAPYLQALRESPSHRTFLEPPRMWSYIIPTSLWNKEKRQWLSLMVDAALTPDASETLDALNNRLQIFNILLQTDFPPYKENWRTN
ncbi:P-loop containing protein [Fusarium phyllophilum]|uniref:P-loop containing protein n=1 Tax=Fusarium phyllophilum TaxID=47803 RepID=A0A8H5NDP7_9HYPO|nr:P-loop containing protein [Fusarium phyllophilum]